MCRLRGRSLLVISTSSALAVYPTIGPLQDDTFVIPTVDRTSYSKAARYGIGHGYDRRPNGARPSSIVVHSTSNPNQKNTPFANEAAFLFNSPSVSAHYLVGKRGEIVEFLNPRWRAWHAGVAVREFDNTRSVGIELHHSVGDPPYPDTQFAALTWLCHYLMAEWNIPATKIETHGQIAIPGPYIRKEDPADWPYPLFAAWRSGLGVTYYRARYDQAIFEAPDPAGRIALDGRAVVRMSDLVPIDEVRADGWCHLLSGVGFVPLGILERLP